METLKYRIIKDGKQYKDYCNALEELLIGQNSDENIDEIELLTLLIEKYDSENDTFGEVDPVTLLQSLMNEHEMRAKDVVDLLNVSKGYVSDILHYRKGMSKEVIRKLADHFKVNQKAFNRPYTLKMPSRLGIPGTRISMNPR
ncbi:helix-turn-helix domain-containing protein [Dyadobacter pollutisoli]|uniref:Helix-turn-helix domain-containing protein n=1 Tax=Dyadobacter pollutisoli TaxID=2910158 RepID=A0A9E8NBP4_9BACT|nr:helix-turn-helix domain-containing protein [Dyadobacter pollutisoli]WAC11364.1 helix-turn-helix domain-containing protein [Dyadobacter pollutisoli]